VHDGLLVVTGLCVPLPDPAQQEHVVVHRQRGALVADGRSRLAERLHRSRRRGHRRAEVTVDEEQPGRRGGGVSPVVARSLALNPCR